MPVIFALLSLAWLAIGGISAGLEATRFVLPLGVFAVWGVGWLGILVALFWEALPSKVDV